MPVEEKRHAGTSDEVRRMQIGGRKERRESWWRERSSAGTSARGKGVLIVGRRESERKKRWYPSGRGKGVLIVGKRE